MSPRPKPPDSVSKPTLLPFFQQSAASDSWSEPKPVTEFSSWGKTLYFMTQDAFDRFIKNKGTEASLGGWVSLDTQDFSAHKSKLHFQKDVIKYIYNEEGMMFHLGPQLTRVTEAALSR
jgi:hypothetical protein